MLVGEALLNNNWQQVRVIKQGRLNTRIEHNGQHRLVPSSEVRNVRRESDVEFDVRRVVPLTPLHYFYQKLRNEHGSRKDRFNLLQRRLQPCADVQAGAYLAELYRRSVQHFASYDNRHEHFAGDERDQAFGEKPLFARKLVQRLQEGARLSVGNGTLTFVDYEINPFRTTLSCFDDGSKAKRSGGGGMDLLAVGDEAVPAVCEIKARTETVGVSFALIQALKYAAELATPAQWIRMKTNYRKQFAETKENPLIDIYLLLEDDRHLDDDLKYCGKLARDFLSQAEATNSIRRIAAFQVRIQEGGLHSTELFLHSHPPDLTSSK